MKPSEVKKKTLESMLEFYRTKQPMLDKVQTSLTTQELKEMGAFEYEGAWVYNHAFRVGEEWASRRYVLMPRSQK